MDGEVTGMPKLQLILDFFSGLEGPYKVLALDDKGKAERVERLNALYSVATFEEYKPIIAEFIKTARIREVWRYQSGVEIVKYNVWTYYSHSKMWGGPYVIDVKYSPDGEFVSYTLDPNEGETIEITATLCDSEDTSETSRIVDILDFCWNMEFNTGMFLEEGNGHAMISVWNFGSEETPSFDLEWMWGSYEWLRMSAEVKSWGAMFDFVRKFIRIGLGEAQRGHEWKSPHTLLEEQERKDASNYEEGKCDLNCRQSDRGMR